MSTACRLLPAPLLLGIALLPLAAHANYVVSTGLDFTGSTYKTNSNFIPPNPMGGVGPNQIVELINGRYSVYNKTTGAQVQTSTLDTFWTNAGVSWSNYTFDPRVVYDPFSQRWYASAADNPGGANNLLFAVSKSADPTAGWTGWDIDSDAGIIIGEKITRLVVVKAYRIRFCNDGGNSFLPRGERL